MSQKGLFFSPLSSLVCLHRPDLRYGDLNCSARNTREGYDNGVWFYVQSKYVAWTFAVESLFIYVWSRLSSRLPGIVVIAVFVALTIPSSVQHFVNFSLAYRHVLLSPDTVRVLQYLRDNSLPGEVVLSCDDLAGPILAMTECHIPAGSYAEYMVPLASITQNCRFAYVLDGLARGAYSRRHSEEVIM